jgi:peptidoglycan/xylan/chitin deacetylase (PgdA/CDA1 family)
MFLRFKINFLVLFISALCLFPAIVFCDYDYNPSTKESPDPRALAIKPTLLKLNRLVVFEVQNGIAALQKGDANTALHSFITAISLEPYDPMSYILLMKTLISMGQEDMAYTWLERSGRNLSDSNQIIANLYHFLQEAYPPVQKLEAPLVSIAQFKDNKECAVSFIFDDGEPSVSTDILPMFEKFGFHTTIAINPGVTSDDTGNIYRGNWDDWRKAKAHGHEIANHGTNHKALPGLSTQELQTEVMDSFQTIQEKVGEPPSSFVFPEDKATPEIVQYVEQKHLVVRDHETLYQTYNRLCIPIYGGKRFSIPTARLLIDIAISRNLWLIPQCHGLYSSSMKKTFKAISPELLNDQLSYLQKNKDKIWVDRFIDVYKYLKERKETQINIKKTSGTEVEFSLTSNLDPAIYSYPLTIIINAEAHNPDQLVAFDQTSKRKIPTRVVKNKIFLEIAPSGQTIHVQWD